MEVRIGQTILGRGREQNLTLSTEVGRGCQAEVHPKVNHPPEGRVLPSTGWRTLQLSLVRTFSLAALHPVPLRPRES